MTASSHTDVVPLLSIVQQPKRARVGQLGEREKRVVDPCPIVQLRILRADGSEDTQAMWEHIFVMHATLFDETGTVECSSARAAAGSTPYAGAQQQAGDEPYERIVFGSLVSSAYYVRDLDERPGCYFCFPDINVRRPGTYRLRFSLLQLPRTEREAVEPTSILGHVMSDPLRVFTPKEFPGVDESTPLTKKFAAQGVGISIRNKGRLKSDDAANN
ncbi:hypothetical protein IWW36_000492 [Coemansia brasiliensis]|uniref:Velvet domain-containing protein n=1 Tax=Coemansia brasiliensis TaxID=2650707 RepID=A0A9W8IDG2_9FUNG|nr:hypothetical protein IWW36_000492 [Coemansia brasiliensis]